MNQPFVFIDVETTGASPTRDRITEIGIVRVENFKKVAEYQTLVNPQMHIPYFIQQMTGINQKMVETAPVFEEVKFNIKEIVADATFVAHNARFDYSFVKNEFGRYHDSYTAKVLCTVRLSRLLYPRLRKHNLSSLINRFSLSVPDRHRAFDDAHALWEFFQKARNDVGKDKFQKNIKTLTKVAQMPSYIKHKSFGDFPDTHGVYKFYGRANNASQGELLYVGKSNSLKKRIYSHFTSTDKARIDLTLSRFTKDIRVEKTAGELGALLLEAHEIKDKKPLLNRSLRKTSSYLVAIEKSQNDYKAISVTSDREVKPQEYEEIVSVFSSKGKLQNILDTLCDEYSLCPKLLGIEKTTRACFASQIGKCKGACSQKESPLPYNLRFAEAFANSKIMRWPFDGAIVFRETSNDLEQNHVLNNWCHLATISKNKDAQDNSVKEYDYSFDWDIYKIMKKFVDKQSSITNLNLENNDYLSKYRL